jgi:DNA polymerase-3 subunit delta'
MVMDEPALASPWLAAQLRHIVATRRAHALLLHGAKGVGEFELAISVAQAWLCEAKDIDPDDRPCRLCASCRLVDAHSHPDLLVLVPAALRAGLGWTTGDEEEGGGDKPGKAKPSKDIKVEAVRAAVAFAQTTAARGRAKVVVVHPAERMNGVAANALLKTLEEPPGLARFVLCSSAPDALLPTIRSRCQSVALALPSTEQGIAWLSARGLVRPEVLLLAAGGQPQEALAWREWGIDGAVWARLPAAVRASETLVFKGWPLGLVIDTLQKLCHDALCVSVGALPRYFPASSIAALDDADHDSRIDGLLLWSRALTRMAADADHPWNADLAVESLVQQGHEALNPARSAHMGTRDESIHSRG